VVLVVDDDDKILPGLVFVSRQLAVDQAVAGEILAMDGGSDCNQHRWVVMYGVGGIEALGIFLADQPGIEVAVHEARIFISADWKAMLEATPRITNCIERFAHAGDGLVAVLAMHDQLGDHRVVEHRNLAALVDAGIDAHTAACRHCCGRFHIGGRRLVFDQAAGRGQEVAERIFGVDAAFHRPALELDPFCVKGSFSPAATRIISSTRSRPVMHSVTGCSTCSRVFISRK
jgi:hypothetical protein